MWAYGLVVTFPTALEASCSLSQQLEVSLALTKTSVPDVLVPSEIPLSLTPISRNLNRSARKRPLIDQKVINELSGSDST